jgi:hypothetical protein
MWRLSNVDPLTLPGRVFIGPMMATAQKQAGGDFAQMVGIAHAMGGLWGVDLAVQDDVFEWDSTNQYWKTAVNNTVGGATNPAAVQGVAGDAKYLYYIESATDEVYRYDGTTFSLLNDQTGVGARSPMVAFGDYLYIADLTTNWAIFEISKATVNTSTAETAIVDFSASETSIAGNNNNPTGHLFVGDERVYFMQVLGDATVIWEITPSSAAGTGFGREVVRYDGLKGEAAWFHMGTVYTVGTDNSQEASGGRRAIMYWQPGGQYGTLGHVRNERGVDITSIPAVSGNANTLLTSAFTLPPRDPGAATDSGAIWVVDAVSGGFFQLTDLAPWSGSDDATVLEFVEFQGQYFVSVSDLAADLDNLVSSRVLYNTAGGIIETPEWDAGLAEDKTLTSIQIGCEALEANTTIAVEYSLDEGAYVSAGTALSTDGSVGTTYVISTDSAPVTFQKLRVKVNLTTTNTANTPVLTAINVRAKATQKQRAWRAILDCSDDQHGTSQSYSGTQKISNIKTAGSAGVVDFKNGYEDRRANQYEQVDVTVDNYQIIMTRAGEGIAVVDLVEVV